MQAKSITFKPYNKYRIAVNINIMKIVSLILLSLLGAFLPTGNTSASGKTQKSHYIQVKNSRDLHAYFRYAADRPIVVSGHRGGMLDGFPENCIESFEKTLSYMESFFEIDPRLTKDGVIVLMHDETIDRTTTGKGKVSDYTYTELQQFHLVDRNGNVTAYKIPTLKECIEWSKGKTILNLDIKDVPLEVMADFIEREKPANVMYTVHNPKQARYYLDRNPDAMFSCWCKSMEEFDQYEKAGIPWGQVMAYVGAKMRPEEQPLYDALHRNGVMCMISVAPTHDKGKTEAEKIVGYKTEIETHPDVIETDYPYLFRGLDLTK